MCTAVSFKTKDHYFGRTLDNEFSYEETVTVCPRNYPFSFRKMPKMSNHYGIIGMAYVLNNYPLFYEGTNEKGLSMAGLKFPGNAFYGKETEGKDNLASFELIPWILGQCETVEQAGKLFENINITDTAFSKALPPSPLHWIISDRDSSITVEAVREEHKSKVNIYHNPVGVLANNPPFPQQMFSLNNYRHLSVRAKETTFGPNLNLEEYSLGLGALGLPGDVSSNSRFIRAAFTKLNSVTGDSEAESVRQFFHIMGTVEQVRGVVEIAPDKYETTIYTSCCNTDKGIYYYTTYDNPSITGVDMHKENLDGEALVSYPLRKEYNITIEN